MSAKVSADPWNFLRRWTPARIGLGRSGGSLPTSAALEFRLDHARARDAVHHAFAFNTLAEKLASYHPEALNGLKEILWEGTADWDDLLNHRAAISGELVLSEFTQHAIQVFLGKK